ncbi:sugar-binding transcriptional regulator [Zafaria sp. J156]|uniref:sugar-binding transcriptional regulator n=1 Tax=Zafaria sp. J156 TaxID=3116490 RepID=UPI002E7783F1|nr:sugar-binding domain-containing protein [Zafaria sp. J156]MEE1621751.1 sugar-binding domain-containing protein [Zafaria sp. J156]
MSSTRPSDAGGTPPDHHQLLADIATSYYLENESKVEIAKAHGISRFQVARYLDEARREGVVTITIKRPVPHPGDLDALAAALGVASIEVARVPGAGEEARDMVARAAAGLLADLARSGNTIGVSWSRTLNLMASHLPGLPGCDMVQLAGDLTVGNDGGSGQLLHRLGAVAGGRTWPLPAPLVVESAQTAESLRRQPEVSEALRRADHLDLAVVALGTWAAGHSTVWARLTEDERRTAAEAGAVAECSGRLLTEDGEPVDGGVDSRVMAVSIAQLRKTPAVIAVATGATGLPGVLAAVKAGIVRHLVVDAELAGALAARLGIEGPEAPGGPGQGAAVDTGGPSAAAGESKR